MATTGTNPDGSERSREDQLARQVYSRLWPTPNAMDGDHGGLVTPEKAREGGTIIEAVSNRTLWTSPTVRDAQTIAKVKRGAGSQAKGSERVEPLAVQAAGGSAIQPTKGLSLNPSWEEWLMAWPIGWTDVARSATVRFRE